MYSSLHYAVFHIYLGGGVKCALYSKAYTCTPKGPPPPEKWKAKKKKKKSHAPCYLNCILMYRV